MIFIIKGQLERNVPIISQLMISADKGLKTSVICTSCDERLRSKLESLGVKVFCTNHKTIGTSYIKKYSDWSQFKTRTLKILNNIYQDELLYIGSVDTGIALRGKLDGYNYIFHIRELYDTVPLYLKLMKKVAKNAKSVVVPEYNRAHILKAWLELDKTPIVIPNKPYEHVRDRFVEISDPKISNVISGIRNKKIILYQGLIGEDRNLKEIAKAFKKINNDDYVIVLMGKKYSDMFEQVRRIYPNSIRIDYVPAPFHLQITSYAHIGIANYGDNNLNNLFCAPNKIYEYSGFGIPTLCRDIPGLRHTIGHNKAGVCVSFDNIENIIEGILEIENNYEYYSRKSNEFFDLVDLSTLFDKLIN